MLGGEPVDEPRFLEFRDVVAGANSWSWAVVIMLICQDLYYGFTRPLWVRTAVTLISYQAAVAS